MSGDTRSRGKKAGGGAAKNSKSNNQAANRQYAAKKQSKERKKMMEKQKQGHSSSCFSSLTFWVLLALIGLSYGTYQTHPEKFKAVFDQLPLQVQDGLVQARDITSDTWDVVITKSGQIYNQGIGMVKEGYSSLPPEVQAYTDPALDATGHYFKLGFCQIRDGYNHVADVILDQYKIHSPAVKNYLIQIKDSLVLAGNQICENVALVFGTISTQFQELYAGVSPQANIYFDEAKTYAKMGLSKTVDLIFDGFDLAYDGYLIVHPYIKQGTDKISEVTGPYVGPYIGPYWNKFYNLTMESYQESHTLAREMARNINFGEVNLEAVLFADEIEKEKLEAAKEAAEKIRIAVEAMNKKLKKRLD